MYFVKLSLQRFFQVVGGLDLDSLSEDARAMIKSLKGDTPLMKMDEVWRELQVAFLKDILSMISLMAGCLTIIGIRSFQLSSFELRQHQNNFENNFLEEIL